jgi:hypothetical protein
MTRLVFSTTAALGAVLILALMPRAHAQFDYENVTVEDWLSIGSTTPHGGGSLPLFVTKPDGGQVTSRFQTSGGGVAFDLASNAVGAPFAENRFTFRLNNSARWRIAHRTATNHFYIQDDLNGNRVMTFLAGGDIGVGTNEPEARFHVVGSIRGEDIFVQDEISAAVVEIRGQGMDLAEGFKINSTMEVLPGMVVSMDPQRPGEMQLSTEPYDRKVAGIISGAGDLHPGILLGDQGERSEGYFPVALTGRVWCWVDASQNPVRVGDMLTTSAVPGHAMAVTQYEQAHGAVLGKAMTNLESGRGLVLVLVSLQ